LDSEALVTAGATCFPDQASGKKKSPLGGGLNP
jgi:hypothetical protein